MRALLLLLLLFIVSSFSLSAAEVSTDAFIYSKSACFGTCPIYQVIVFEDGIVIFNGIEYVKQKGYYKFQTSPDLFQKILLIKDKYNVESFKNSYGYSDKKTCKEKWTDYPTTTSSFQIDGKVKTIEHYHGCKGFEREDDLNSMEKQIDKVLNLQSFVGK